jgi:zinc transport system substrate-binding protein
MILMFTSSPRRLPHRRSAIVLTIASGALAITGCSAPAATDPDAPSKPLVVVGLYPYEYVAQEVGGDLIEVSNLTQPGAEPHDLELTGKQVARVGEADLVVFQRGLQPAVDAAIEQSDPAHPLDVTTIVSLLEGYEEDEGEEGHASGPVSGLDPHVWLDTNRLTAITTAVAQALIEIDPDHAADYTANADDLARRLSAVDAEYRDNLAQCETRVFIVSHAAFGYLAERYDLTQLPLAGLSPDAEPTPAWVAEVQRLATAHNVTTVFTEPLSSPAMAESLAEDLGLNVDSLDPIEGITPESAAADYIGLMETNLDSLITASGCA